jgi:hypothetical protein
MNLDLTMLSERVEFDVDAVKDLFGPKARIVDVVKSADVPQQVEQPFISVPLAEIGGCLIQTYERVLDDGRPLQFTATTVPSDRKAIIVI